MVATKGALCLIFAERVTGSAPANLLTRGTSAIVVGLVQYREFVDSAISLQSTNKL